MLGQKTDRTQLIFKSVSEIVGAADIGLLILTDEQEERQIAIPCNSALVNDFRHRLTKGGSQKPTLAETLWSFISRTGEYAFEIEIECISQGEYTAVLSETEHFSEEIMDVGQAILLSYISHGEVLIFLDTQLFQRQSTPYDPHTAAIALPVNVLSPEMLQSALDKAIETENYELAQQLKQELENRKKNNNDNQ